MENVKKLGLKLLSFLPLIGIIVGVNLWVDPANLRQGDHFYSVIGHCLLDGKNVANLEDYDERLLQKEYLSILKKKPDILVLGSSRVLQINGTMLSSKMILNCGVSGATVEDLIGVYQLYLQRGWIPSQVIIGLDPWMLNAKNEQKRYKSIEKEYLQFLNPKSTSSGFNFEKWWVWFSPSYFQTSVKVGLLRLVSPRSNWVATTESKSKESLKFPDGSHQYSEKVLSRTSKEVMVLAKTYASEKKVYSLGEYRRLDPQLCQKFEALFEHFKQHDVHVICVLSPYHPVAYDILSKREDCKQVVVAESWFRSLAKRYDAKVVGSYDPALCGANASDFYDGMHPKGSVFLRLFQ